MVIVAGNIQDSNGLVMKVQFRPRDDFCQLFQCPHTTWEGNEALSLMKDKDGESGGCGHTTWEGLGLM